MNGSRFATVEIKTAAQGHTKSAYQKLLKDWKKRKYFEGKTDIDE